MPYMYCNQEGCNETVKLPSEYCVNHKPTKKVVRVEELLTTKVDEAQEITNPNNTTK